MTAYHRTWQDRMAMASASLAVALILAASIVFAVSLWWPYEPLTRMEIEVVGNPRVGGDLDVRLDYCKTSTRWIPSEIRWTLINDVMVSIDGPKAALPVGCEGDRMTTI